METLEQTARSTADPAARITSSLMMFAAEIVVAVIALVVLSVLLTWGFTRIAKFLQTRR